MQTNEVTHQYLAQSQTSLTRQKQNLEYLSTHSIVILPDTSALPPGLINLKLYLEVTEFSLCYIYDFLLQKLVYRFTHHT